MKAHPPYFILQKTTEFGENISIFTLTRNSVNEMKHRLKHSCCMTTREELTFWGVEDLMMELCCNSNYMEERKLNEKINTNTRHWKRQQSSIRISEESYGTSIKDILRKRIWYLLEYSNSSSAAKVRNRD